ncbi:Thiamine-binding periplasmic protein [Vibrio stylophorae]|uniref:Thiamine-binding periplasmic protein n=1 Tax=Vibrio stylophorae TaxID=659351 RepID=A0ABM8ZQF3_9VIBR|nr:thiamine ABC transporter substrate binding subunit [Vibrio stylophorae]CAH0532528.1 Thiamine-binding periplasmic protein [Vibrio stylophorae]
MLRRLLALSLLFSPFAFANSAPQKPVLTVYTYSSFASEWGPGPAIEKAFEAQCDCDLQWVALDDGVSILNRVRLEGARSKADVVLGLDNNLLTEAKKTGLFAPHQLSSIKLVPALGDWHNDTFVPYDYGYFAFVYRQDKLSTPPTSMKALLADQSIKVIYQDPRTSTPGQGLMLWLQTLYGDQAAQAWQQLASHTVTVTKGWSEAYNLFLQGEADMVLSYTSSPAYHIIAENDQRFAAAIFDEGNYRQVEVAAQLKHAPQPQLAQQFLQFVLTPDFQSQMATGNWMYPVTDVLLPKGFDALPKPVKSLELSADDIAQHRRQWIRQWQQALVQ